MAELSADERAAIVAEWTNVSAAWKPKDFYGHGCVMIVVGILLFLGIPKLSKAISLGIPGWLKLVVLVVAVVLVLCGWFVMQTRQLQANPADLVEGSVKALAAGGPDDSARRHDAITLLFHYADIRGPGMRSNYDPTQILPRLGNGADYVMDVERVLIEEVKLSPIFTAPRS